MEQLSTARVLQEMMDYAVACHSTDIHMTLSGQRVCVEFRVSGVIRPFIECQSRGGEMFRRLKALARMDVTDRLMPQEGAFTWDIGERSFRMRVSSIPVYDGESLVLRILGDAAGTIPLQSLGLSAFQMAQLTTVLDCPNGLCVVAGRTGAGKTTTLYAMMQHLAAQGRQVFSVEDPVEMSVAHCRQVEVHERQGFTYAIALRALLRQDPDVLMIGEIRDEETARIAYRAALTGRLVLATTHADGIDGVMSRFADLGIPRSILSDVLHTVITQKDERTNSGTINRRFVIENNFTRLLRPNSRLGELGEGIESDSMETISSI